MRTLVLLSLAMIAPADDRPPAAPVDATCVDYKDTHVLVRRDVLTELDKSHTKLGLCEQSLSRAQTDMRKLDAHVDSLDSVIGRHESQQKILQEHITHLEHVIQRQNDYITTLESARPGFWEGAWENVDGMVGLGAGYALGTATCVGMAWVFNQPQFGGDAPQ